jgi:hypothetical protein
MQTFLHDLRFGFRMLRHTPGFSILAILCLTLGIGTNAAALSWIEGILVRPYPLVAHQDQMVALSGVLSVSLYSPATSLRGAPRASIQFKPCVSNDDYAGRIALD